MENSQIKEIALANGFSLKEQLGGHMDLNPYVYEFAQAIKKEALEQARSVYGQSAVTDADTDSIDSDIDKARDSFIEKHLLDDSESEELEMLVSKSVVLGELYERKKWQEGNGLAIHEALNTGEAHIGYKLEEFKKLWIAGGGHFAHFTYLPKEGEWSISSVGLPENAYPILLNALVTLNTAWVFYLGAWSKCEALARKEKNGLSADLGFSKLRELELEQKLNATQSWIAVEVLRATKLGMDYFVVPNGNVADSLRGYSLKHNVMEMNLVNFNSLIADEKCKKCGVTSKLLIINELTPMKILGVCMCHGCLLKAHFGASKDIDSENDWDLNVVWEEVEENA